MTAQRYCIVQPEPLSCVKSGDVIMLDPDTQQGQSYIAAMEADGYMVLPEADAMATYGACPIDPNEP